MGSLLAASFLPTCVACAIPAESRFRWVVQSPNSNPSSTFPGARWRIINTSPKGLSTYSSMDRASFSGEARMKTPRMIAVAATTTAITTAMMSERWDFVLLLGHPFPLLDTGNTDRVLTHPRPLHTRCPSSPPPPSGLPPSRSPPRTPPSRTPALPPQEQRRHRSRSTRCAPVT